MLKLYTKGSDSRWFEEGQAPSGYKEKETKAAKAASKPAKAANKAAKPANK